MCIHIALLISHWTAHQMIAWRLMSTLREGITIFPFLFLLLFWSQWICHAWTALSASWDLLLKKNTDVLSSSPIKKGNFFHVVGPTVLQLYPFSSWGLRDKSGPVSVSVPSFKRHNPCEEVSHLRAPKFAAPRRNAATEDQIKMKTTWKNSIRLTGTSECLPSHPWATIYSYSGVRDSSQWSASWQICQLCWVAVTQTRCLLCVVALLVLTPCWDNSFLSFFFCHQEGLPPHCCFSSC